MTSMREKPKLLLHTCCGPCSTSVVERLAAEYHIALFFYNPNITDPEEYAKRITGEIQYLQCYNRSVNAEDRIELLEGSYDPDSFRSAVVGLEDEPEGGMRCMTCYKLRLARTAETAKEKGFDAFSTTLSVSPHKNHSWICQIGNELASGQDPVFLGDDFKTKGGYQRSIELAKEIGLYRQNYCGCEFSKNEQLKRRTTK
ncbi:MAG: recombinase [Firmicutes bacterium HGW-Firmicutes-11]|nr:MAG: recombinase [Firmicutes bacterium HGW-Firmicutes-11]